MTQPRHRRWLMAALALVLALLAACGGDGTDNINPNADVEPLEQGGIVIDEPVDDSLFMQNEALGSEATAVPDFDITAEPLEIPTAELTLEATAAP